jgi:ATP-dependent Clp protease ATP-binding subunit ClpC
MFSERAKSVLAQSHTESVRLRHDATGSGHILLAILREADGRAADILTALGIDRDDAAARVLARLGPGTRTAEISELAYAKDGKDVLGKAIAIAAELGDSVVGVEHLLAGLLAVEDGDGGQVLMSMGLTAAAVRARLRRER